MDPNQNQQQENAKVGSSVDSNIALGILAYLGPLIIISYIMGNSVPEVKFHINQGLVILVGEFILWIMGAMFWQLLPIVDLLDLGLFILVVLGIINVVQHKQKELPLVGQFSKYFKF